MSVSEQLRNHLCHLCDDGVSLYVVAKSAGVGVSTLHDFVHGRTKHLRPVTFERLVKALGLALCQVGPPPSPGPPPGRPKDKPPRPQRDTTDPTPHHHEGS